MNKEAINTIIDFLAKLPTSEFDIMAYRLSERECGTACCVAGHFPNIFPSEYKYNEDGWVETSNSYTPRWTDMLSDKLEIPMAHCMVLFNSGFCLVNVKGEEMVHEGHTDKVTPAKVIESINQYMSKTIPPSTYYKYMPEACNEDTYNKVNYLGG